MKNDRELLAACARAVHMEMGPEVGQWLAFPFGVEGYARRNANGTTTVWNPLKDDGDTLRLANRTGTCIEFGYCADDAPIVRCGSIEERDNWPQVANFPDSGAATRRAVVEAVAAAQITYEDAVNGVVRIPEPMVADLPGMAAWGEVQAALDELTGNVPEQGMGRSGYVARAVEHLRRALGADARTTTAGTFDEPAAGVVQCAMELADAYARAARGAELCDDTSLGTATEVRNTLAQYLAACVEPLLAPSRDDVQFLIDLAAQDTTPAFARRTLVRIARKLADGAKGRGNGL